MIASTQMRPGMVIKFNNELFSVFSVNHRTPGNLRGFVQAKMRNLRSGFYDIGRPGDAPDRAQAPRLVRAWDERTLTLAAA